MISECYMINPYHDNKSQMRRTYTGLHDKALDLGVPDWDVDVCSHLADDEC